jgi:hypothetical protein
VEEMEVSGGVKIEALMWGMVTMEIIVVAVYIGINNSGEHATLPIL